MQLEHKARLLMTVPTHGFLVENRSEVLISVLCCVLGVVLFCREVASVAWGVDSGVKQLIM